MKCHLKLECCASAAVKHCSKDLSLQAEVSHTCICEIARTLLLYAAGHSAHGTWMPKLPMAQHLASSMTLPLHLHLPSASGPKTTCSMGTNAIACAAFEMLCYTAIVHGTSKLCRQGFLAAMVLRG